MTCKIHTLVLLLAMLPAAALAQNLPQFQTSVQPQAAAPTDAKSDTNDGAVLNDSIIASAVRIGVMEALTAYQQKMGYDYRSRRGFSLFRRNPHQPKPKSPSRPKRRVERINREDLKATFIPKGTWMLGGTINYQEWDTENMNLLVLKNMEHEGHTFSGSPYFGYFISRNVAIGGRYNYNRNYFYLGQFDLNLGEDFNISLADLYYQGHSHTGSMFVRTYMPIGKSKVFGFFSEFDAQYSYQTSKNSTGRGEDFDGSYETTHTLSLGFMPGISAFVTDFAAVEASIGIMGLNYKWSDQKTNQVEVGKSQSGGANFKFNLFSVNIGMSFYF